MLGYLEAVGADIVPDRISVQSVAAVDGITGLRPHVGGHAQQSHGPHHNTQLFHFQFPLLAVQKAKSILGPAWKSV